MRRESLFDPLARSKVGALGLMQLMPSTARNVARSLGMKRPRQAVALAAAAYNAGPNNVRRWLPKNETMSADLWVETVPFNETRNYVQAVLAYSTVFDRSLGKTTLMSSRMDEIKSRY